MTKSADKATSPEKGLSPSGSTGEWPPSLGEGPRRVIVGTLGRTVRESWVSANKPEPAADCCLWCGDKLPAYRWRKESWAAGLGLRVGYNGDGAFCGLWCGYAFGTLAARSGFRFRRGP